MKKKRDIQLRPDFGRFDLYFFGGFLEFALLKGVLLISSGLFVCLWMWFWVGLLFALGLTGWICCGKLYSIVHGCLTECMALYIVQLGKYRWTMSNDDGSFCITTMDETPVPRWTAKKAQLAGKSSKRYRLLAFLQEKSQPHDKDDGVRRLGLLILDDFGGRFQRTWAVFFFFPPQKHHKSPTQSTSSFFQSYHTATATASAAFLWQSPFESIRWRVVFLWPYHCCRPKWYFFCFFGGLLLGKS